jgi:hypothetical protein
MVSLQVKERTLSFLAQQGGSHFAWGPVLWITYPRASMEGVSTRSNRSRSGGDGEVMPAASMDPRMWVVNAPAANDGRCLSAQPWLGPHPSSRGAGPPMEGRQQARA